jgi:uncharacterized protein
MKHRSEDRKETHSSSHPSPQASPQQGVDIALIIFAKAPNPGQVKTRLCPPLTADEAATLHGSFVLDTLERTKTLVGRLKLPSIATLPVLPLQPPSFSRSWKNGKP